jgi:hypothetical protein
MSNQWVVSLRYGISIQEPKPIILTVTSPAPEPKAREYQFIVFSGYGWFQAIRDAIFGGIALNNYWNFRWYWIRDIW